MNEKNFEYLKKLLENLGFGSRLNAVLESALNKELTLFTLGINNTHTSQQSKLLGKADKEMVRYELNFSKSKTTDAVFLNDYKVALYKPGEALPREHTFDLERDQRVTALQAYKLLSGFALEKEIFPSIKEGQGRGSEMPEKIKVWYKLALDITDAFSQHPLRKFYPEYGFNLESTLDRYPLIGLSVDPLRSVALQDLRSGRLVKAEMKLFDQAAPVYFSANPQTRTLDLYDKDMRRIPENQIFPEKLQKAEKTEREAPGQQPAATTVQAAQSQPWQQDPSETQAPRIRR